MNKRILIVLSVVFVAIIAMGTVSAFEIPGLGSLFGSPPDQNVTVDGETFHIPGTFKENGNVSKNTTVNDYTFFTSTDYVKGYKNDTNYLNILISEYNNTNAKDFENYMNGTSKNVNGTEGYLYNDGIGYTFTYAKGNKVISIQSDNEKLIARAIA